MNPWTSKHVYRLVMSAFKTVTDWHHQQSLFRVEDMDVVTDWRTAFILSPAHLKPSYLWSVIQGLTLLLALLSWLEICSPLSWNVFLYLWIRFCTFTEITKQHQQRRRRLCEFIRARCVTSAFHRLLWLIPHCVTPCGPGSVCRHHCSQAFHCMPCFMNRPLWKCFSNLTLTTNSLGRLWSESLFEVFLSKSFWSYFSLLLEKTGHVALTTSTPQLRAPQLWPWLTML